MDTKDLAFRTLGEVERLHHEGYVTQDQYEGYTHAWATSAIRFGDYSAWEKHEFATSQAEAVAMQLGCCKDKETVPCKYGCGTPMNKMRAEGGTHYEWHRSRGDRIIESEEA